MDKPFYELDPDGDIILVLRHPNAPFAVWGESGEDFSKPPSPVAGPEPEDGPAAPVADDLEAEPANIKTELVADASFEPNVANSETLDADHTKRSEIQFRLSSRHLVLASSFFRKALEGPWKEGHSVTSDGCRYIHTEEWDPDALLVLMQIIHGRNWSVPSHTAEPAATADTRTSSAGIEAIDQRRQESVDRIVIALHDLLERFRNRQAGCSFECSSILLGALTIQMHTADILEPLLKPPYLGYNFTVVTERSYVADPADD
ncbi:hypothetical protein DL767_000676 [Monosporascus sp. MG133]|nr:hypothetical protein DL767_000676 [Monosporascus sp. MG133]